METHITPKVFYTDQVVATSWVHKAAIGYRSGMSVESQTAICGEGPIL